MESILTLFSEIKTAHFLSAVSLMSFDTFLPWLPWQPLSLWPASDPLLCSSSCCVTVCCSWRSFWCPVTWSAPSPPSRGVTACPARSRGYWLLLMRLAGKLSSIQSAWQAESLPSYCCFLARWETLSSSSLWVSLGAESTVRGSLEVGLCWPASPPCSWPCRTSWVDRTNTPTASLVRENTQK